ncbi:DUF4112 domain-containing protein [Alteromonas aestuariivivens]|uniref:DUF4112 domain-containing protein n=1 Tax=Alteromonas aestuariivivens TaxID=1938339 RepID=A0A3D8M7A0_9ALTE|nr:DUF4112 domain-containing protein [Alteromonas aestuariivivens]RDV25632.1 DUF4112 domain-containing protein [Alteromonas aestuariivivens]
MSLQQHPTKAPEALLKAQKMANLMDTAVKIPFVPVRIGIDPIVGLIPGGGDVLMLLVALRIIWLGKQLGLPKRLIARMVRNSLIDFGLGFFPIVGDIIDVFYKANRANVRIMEKWWLAQNKLALDGHTHEQLRHWEQVTENRD